MDFTFGIVTNGNNDNFLNIIITSIREEKILNYEIIIIGNTLITGDDIVNVPFNENERSGWITRKKNIITELSRYENIVYLHDYIYFLPGWYKGQLLSGNDFTIRMDKIINYDGSRFRDWCLWVHNNNYIDTFIGRDALIPYNLKNLTKYMYISGSYWISKKYVMEEFKLNENLSWGGGEDVEWSKLVREKYNFSMNINSSVKILKQNKDRVFNEPNGDKLLKLITIDKENNK